MIKEYKFEIGDSTKGDIGAVFYVQAGSRKAARKKLAKFTKASGNPIRERYVELGVECLFYFGDGDRLASRAQESSD